MKRPKIFYGWWIVAGQLARTILLGAAGPYTFGLFAVALCDDFGWTRAQFYFAHTISTVLGAISGPFVGVLVDKYGIKLLMPLGAFMGGTLFALLSLTHSLWYLYGLYFIMPLAAAGAGAVPFNTMITNWFEKKRGIVLGILATGIGWSGVFMTPLIASIITNLGWRAAYAILGVARALFVVPLVTFVFRLRPEEKGLLPDGRSPEAQSEAPSTSNPGEGEEKPKAGWTLKAAIREPAFWLLFMTFVSFRFGLNVVIYHAMPFFIDEGIPTATAAILISCIAFSGIAGKLAGGYTADRIGPRPVAIFAYGLHAVAIFIAVMANSMSMYWVFAVLFGFSLGLATPMMVMLVAQCFGRESFGAIFGTIRISMSIGIGIGPLFSAYLFDTTGSYNMSFLIGICFLIVACITIYLARPPKLKEPTPSTTL